MEERLIELLANIDYACDNGANLQDRIDYIADYLLENGVTVLPCKVGDMVYKISRKPQKERYIQKTEVSRVAIDADGVWIFCKCNPVSRCVFGKSVFLTKEEAEKALKGREK